MSVKKALLAAAGCVCLGVGAVGTVLPVLPGVPLLLLAAFCFANASDRLHGWFSRTKLYQDHVETYLRRGGLPLKTKLRIVGLVTVIMLASGVFVLRGIVAAQIAFALVWVAMVLCFAFVIKTVPESEDGPTALAEAEAE